MKKKIAVIAAMLFSAATIYGQGTKSGDLSRQISVAKDFAPTVDKASKLEIRPQSNDTMMLRPDFEYTVRPKPWTSGFNVTPIRPATVDPAVYDPQYPFYMKAGGGYPGQTLFDFYANTTRKGRNNLGFYINHYGQLADIDVEGNGKTNAKSTRNTTGVFGTVGVGRYALSGEIGWDYDVFSFYGDYQWFGKSVPMQHYSAPRARIIFGDDFSDLSHFNFRLGTDGYLLEDRYDNKETGISAFVEVGKRNITLKADIESYKGGGARDGIRNMIVRGGPRYELRTDVFLFRMGAIFAYEENSKEPEYFNLRYGDLLIEQDDYNKVHFLPEIELRLSLAGGKASPYITLNSSLTANTLRRLTTLNPYMGFYNPDLILYNDLYPDYKNSPHYMYPSTAEYNLRAGISGTIGSKLSYNIFAGGDQLKITPAFERKRIIILLYPLSSLIGTTISPYFFEPTEMTVLTAGAELSTRIGGSFTLTAAGQYFKNKVKGLDEVYYLPKYTASLDMTYNHRDKLLLRTGVKVRGKYGFILNGVRDEDMKAPTAADVSLGAQYNLSSTFGIFVEGNNLANQKLYPYPYYQGVGVNVSAGVKVRF